ncbi:unnamed protein product [Protopolystoma xenopodis]|uniref:Uncharacterized protein n=1 Tax=Protopolystoma xenopodis TaxID=117903 RepID=A0A448X8P9_9PLAT|nr:unnamed protein product [Protopolystoma xenopodis]
MPSQPSESAAEWGRWVIECRSKWEGLFYGLLAWQTLVLRVRFQQDNVRISLQMHYEKRSSVLYVVMPAKHGSASPSRACRHTTCSPCLWQCTCMLLELPTPMFVPMGEGGCVRI